MAPDSRMSTGSGEGTTRRQPRPSSSATVQPRAAARRSASSRSRNGPIGLVGRENAGSAGSTVTWVTSAAGRTRGHPETRRSASEIEAAHLPLGHRSEVEERLLGDEARALLVGDGEAADLGAVAVDDDHAPAGPEQRHHRPGHGQRVRLLLRVGARLPGTGEGVAAQRDHRDPAHLPPSRPSSMAYGHRRIVNASGARNQGCTGAAQRRSLGSVDRQRGGTWRGVAEVLRPRNLVQPGLLLLLAEAPGHGYDLAHRLDALLEWRWELADGLPGAQRDGGGGAGSSAWERSETARSAGATRSPTPAAAPPRRGCASSPMPARCSWGCCAATRAASSWPRRHGT